jgi:hypothetical protein
VCLGSLVAPISRVVGPDGVPPDDARPTGGGPLQWNHAVHRDQPITARVLHAGVAGGDLSEDSRDPPAGARTANPITGPESHMEPIKPDLRIAPAVSPLRFEVVTLPQGVSPEMAKLTAHKTYSVDGRDQLCAHQQIADLPDRDDNYVLEVVPPGVESTSLDRGRARATEEGSKDDVSGSWRCRRPQLVLLSVDDLGETTLGADLPRDGVGAGHRARPAYVGCAEKASVRRLKEQVRAEAPEAAGARRSFASSQGVAKGRRALPSPVPGASLRSATPATRGRRPPTR